MKMKSKIIGSSVLSLFFLAAVFLVVVLFSSRGLIEKVHRRNTDSLLREKKKQLEYLTNTSLLICEAVYRSALGAPHIHKDECINIVMAELDKYKYDKDGYFFLYDLSSNQLLLPSDHEYSGQDLYNIQDINGVYFIRDIIDNGMKGGGYTEYFWKRPSDGMIEKKLVYSTLFKKWNFIIGTGFYVDRMDKELLFIEALVKKARMHAITAIIIGFLILIPLVTFFISYHIKKVLKLMHVLTSTMKLIVDSVHSGSMFEGKEITVVSGGELKYLTDSFNTMSASIRDLTVSRAELNKEIKERNNAEKKLLRIRKAMDSSSEGVILFCDKGYYLYSNKAAEKILGYQPENDVSSTPELNTFFEASTFSLMVVNRTTNESFKEQIVYKHEAGYSLLLDVSLDPVNDNDNNRVGWVVRYTDITEEKKMVMELKRAHLKAEQSREEAERAAMAKSVFFASMNHEVRTPLNAILGFTDLLKGEVSSDKGEKYLQSITLGGRRLLHLLNDIFDLSRIDAGKVKLNPKPICIRELLRYTEQSLKSQVEGKGLDFMVHVEQEVPAELFLDEERLRQVLYIVSGSAVKYTAKGFVRLSAAVENKGSETLDLYIYIEDTGVGITEDDLNEMLNTFEHPAERTAGLHGGSGSGLGLTISHKLVDIMNGSLTVQKKQDRGSIYTVQLRDIKFSDSEVVTRVVKQHKQYKQQVGQDTDITILIADDVLLNRELIKGFLAESNYSIIEAEHGREAVELARIHHPDVILLDMKMPVMDGYQAAAILKEDEQLQAIPVIAITASVMQDYQEKIYGAGCNGFIRKPIARKSLLDELERFIGKKKGDNRPQLLQQMPEKSSISNEKATELLEKLKHTVLPRWEKVQNRFILHELKQFALEAGSLGKEYTCQPLVGWSDDVIEMVDSIDVEKLPLTFEKFPELVTLIREQMK